MTIHLTIDERIAVHRGPLPDAEWMALSEWAKSAHSLDNPAYWEARKHRRPCKHLPRRFELATVSDATLSLPRGGGLGLKRWLREHLPQVAVTVEDLRCTPPIGALTLQVDLRDYQVQAVDRATVQRDGVIVAPTGAGKTVIAMGLIARLQTRALVLVHTKTLVDQVRLAAQRCLGIETGIIAAGQHDLRDVTVATVQSLIRRDPQLLRDHFGLVILDEAHHCPAATFTEVMQRFAARWRIGLTATPERADRLDPLMLATLGPELIRLQPKALQEQGSLCPAELTPVETTFAGGRLVDHNSMIARLIADPTRNQQVVDTVRATRGRRSLVLTERVDHCTTLTEALQGAGVAAESLIGRLDDEARRGVLQRFLDGEGRVLVATTALVGEGFDCPELDTLYLTVPSGNVARVTQALGRVLRAQPGKDVAKVYDFVDVKTPGLARKLSLRLQVYRAHGVRCGSAVPALRFAPSLLAGAP